MRTPPPLPGGIVIIILIILCAVVYFANVQRQLGKISQATRQHHVCCTAAAAVAFRIVSAVLVRCFPVISRNGINEGR